MGTAIRAPSDDLKNHTTVLTQLKEIAETGLGIRGNPASAYVKISDLVAAGLINYISGVISPSAKTAGGSLTTVSVLNSIVGNGTVGTPIQLSGDAASPGNNMIYGTNGSGVKSWYAAAGGTSPLTTKGDIYGFSTVNTRVPVGSDGQIFTADSTQASGVKWAAGGVSAPGTINDLVYWFQGDQHLMNAGSALLTMKNSCPWMVTSPDAVNAGATRSATQLNSKNVFTFPGSNVGNYNFQNTPPLPLQKSTIFVVIKPGAVASGYDIVCGPSGALEFAILSGNLVLYQSFTAVIGTCTAPLSVGTWYQANATYDNSSGAWAFRQARATAGSGTQVRTIITGVYSLAYSPPGANQWLNADLAELIIYNRVLTGAEITTVENYLFGKWGV